jgi:hypothetical protein
VVYWGVVSPNPPPPPLRNAAKAPHRAHQVIYYAAEQKKGFELLRYIGRTLFEGLSFIRVISF